MFSVVQCFITWSEPSSYILITFKQFISNVLVVQGSYPYLESLDDILYISLLLSWEECIERVKIFQGIFFKSVIQTIIGSNTIEKLMKRPICQLCSRPVLSVVF